ncbi:hypothetical protein [Micromonospora sp. CPCC 206061]|uniref:hypothetical protein n=1 Tax=Micromonospora sp. CPCC 206061 TaxID=3122410 RepID=UPI002FF0750C
MASRYAPVVRLVAQEEECGYGEPYLPLDVDRLFDQPTVALRGPWAPTDLVKIGPSADDLAEGRYEYHLDFPGDPLNPGCGYERWGDRITGTSRPTVYAHVATDPGVPGKLALQYWFFYVFNDYNNKHEGDWEMIQLIFDASSVAAALTVDPVSVGYSQHEGAERAAWDSSASGDGKLELVDGTHPVVHPAAGSHANHYEDALYLGSSASEGVGCDDSTRPSVEVRPVVRTIPQDPALARASFPWIGYEGRWGELQQAFYNGPTGPAMKRQWSEPITWSQDSWRDEAFAVPAGGLLGTGATDFFCESVRTGSDALRRVVSDPSTMLMLIAVLVALVLYIASRTTWHPADPLPMARRRAWGQTLVAAARMYRRHWPLFAGIGLIFLPITVLGAALESALAGLAWVGAALTLAGVGLVMAVTATALVEVDAGRDIGPLRAYRMGVARYPKLLGALAIAIAVVIALSLSLALVPLGVWLAGRWALLAPVAALEDPPPGPVRTLRRSSELVRGRWLKVTTLSVVAIALALALGPVLGTVLILFTDAPFALLNVVSGAVYALAMPLAALTTAYTYADTTTEPVGTAPALPPTAPPAPPPVAPREERAWHGS